MDLDQILIHIDNRLDQIQNITFQETRQYFDSSGISVDEHWINRVESKWKFENFEKVQGVYLKRNRKYYYYHFDHSGRRTCFHEPKSKNIGPIKELILPVYYFENKVI